MPGQSELTTNLAGRFQDVDYRLEIEGADRPLAATVPHSTPVLTDGALNCQESNLEGIIAESTAVTSDFLPFKL